MSRKYEPAQVRVRVPDRRWKSRAEVEAWARDQLAGGPAVLRATVPEGHADMGKPGTWKHVQEGVFAGKYVLLVSDPPGLIVRDTETDGRRFVPSASKTGLVLGKTRPDAFIDSINEERDLRAFVQSENAVFNKEQQRMGESGNRNWTVEWYRHGRRIKEFVSHHSGVSTERVWQELVKWGQGQHGYGRQTHQDSTYFYEWLGEVGEHQQVFELGTTRIQHILWADRTKVGRERLLEAVISGPLRSLTDDEFAWVVGKRIKNWPLDEASHEELTTLGNRIRSGEPLSEAERERMAELLRSATKQAVRRGAKTHFC